LYRLQNRFVARLYSPRQIVRQLFDAASRARHLELGALQRELFAPFDALSNAKHLCEREAKRQAILSLSGNYPGSAIMRCAASS
jgi:hypothetical protein